MLCGPFSEDVDVDVDTDVVPEEEPPDMLLMSDCLGMGKAIGRGNGGSSCCKLIFEAGGGYSIER